MNNDGQSVTESKKDGELRNQVPEEDLKSEEGWHEILNSLLNFFTFLYFLINYDFMVDD